MWSEVPQKEIVAHPLPPAAYRTSQVTAVAVVAQRRHGAGLGRDGLGDGDQRPRLRAELVAVVAVQVVLERVEEQFDGVRCGE